eukprot:scaffold2962_cov126-Cylindrotheca_fusiformis.AAC.7
MMERGFEKTNNDSTVVAKKVDQDFIPKKLYEEKRMVRWMLFVCLLGRRNDEVVIGVTTTHFQNLYATICRLCRIP